MKLEFPDELPITPRMGDIVKLMREHRVLIVAGETGSGKTTQLPKACLAAGWGRRGMIAHTQPRRLAARTVAARIAAEMCVEVGAEVGYAVRFSERTSPATVVKVMTDGLLLNDIQRDRQLRRYECVIVDEAHERSLNVDFLLGYLRRLLERRDDLKVVVTSATIDVEAFAKHFGGAPVVEVSGRGYPVETIYRPTDDVERGVVDALREIGSSRRRARDGTSPSPTGPSDDDMLPVTTARDVLVFQSGEREIFETTQLLRREFEDRFEIMPLYARLPEREQQRVFQPGRRQRVVLATNVAETSITVPNIGYVIDPGFARISRYSYRAKLQQLPIEPISQASARQRAGRCGRIAPGVCYRLCSEDDFEARPLYTDPELTRTNLAAVVLTMRAFRLGDIESFPFIDPPNPRAVRDAIGLLHELQALEGDRLTELGRTMARLPVDPRLARMMVEGDRRGSLAEVLVIVSALASQDPRLRPLDRRDAADRAHAAFADKTSDFLAYVNLWRWLEQTRQENTRSAFNRLLQKRFLSPSRIREWRSLHRQLLLGCRGLGMRVNDKPAKYATIHRALLTGSLSFVGVKSERAEHTGRGTKRRRDQYEGARGLRFGLFPGSALGRSRPKWVMAAEVSTTGRTYARCVAEVAPSWIERAALHLVKRSYTEPRWDPKRGEAMVREQVTFYGLVVVGQRPKRAVEVDREAARKIFVRAALVESDERLHAPFIDHNRGLIERLEELCAKGRRPGLMVSESKRLRFYLDRLPDDVCSIPAFNAFVRGAGDKKLAALHMTEADLVGDSTASADERDFPTLIRFGDTDIPLAYKFAPGEPDDGVSLRVDSRLLMQLDRNALDWLVPGFFEEKCLALGKMLPKSLRRKLAPLGENMRVVQERLRQSDVYRQGNLADALSDAVRACRGVEVPPDAWRLHDLPAHLGMNVQIRGTRQRVLDQDRDVDALRRRHQTFTERNLTADRRKSVEVRGMTEFPNTGLPESLVVEDGVQRSVLYPVLVDRGNSVDLLVRATAEGRSALNRDAYTRLAMLAEPRSARELRREVEHDGTMMIHFAPLGSPAALVDDMVAAAFWFACFDGSALPRSKAEFDACARIGAGALRGTFSEILEQARQVLTRRTEVANSLDGLASPAFARSREDMARQLRNLVPPDFLRTTPRAQLAEVPRYLDGIAYRIGNLHGRVQRDLAGIERVAVWERRFAEVADQTEDPSSGMVTELRFLVEEFRIATFAQRIGTREKISDKRMAIRFDAAKSRSTSHERLARQRTLPC
ncbi:MAG: ATP-dependent RNA helicase HrpA [Gammaproteobacteria bacterium]|nr:ATP-dependent RNA helicase HrpA [Gammaproteobacteria bacterium]